MHNVQSLIRVDQYTVGSESDARAIKNGLYAIDNYANQIQFWCYVCAGLAGMLIAGMYAAKYIIRVEEAEQKHLHISPSDALD